MNQAEKEGDVPGFEKARDFLCVDQFIQDFVFARALKTAFDMGLVDQLVNNNYCSFGMLRKKWNMDDNSVRLLTGLLAANGVVIESSEGIEPTREFLQSLQYRDLLELKLNMAQVAALDALDYFDEFITTPGDFRRKSRFFKLFDYSLCFDDNPLNRRLTKRWMAITSTLTKYESQVCLECYDFGRHHRMLDIGGNSGEFALRVCRRYPHVTAAVLDLPLVCDLGREHVQPHPERDRITFIKGNALSDDMPGGFDLITFKSMLHDWPPDDARHLISRAAESLTPAGTLLIFERGPIELISNPIPYSLLPFLIFSHSYRSPVIYEKQLENLGFQDITTQKVDLEMPFFLVTARKK